MDKRVEKIKEYLDRISRGEDFDRIRTEFVRDFQDVGGRNASGRITKAL